MSLIAHLFVNMISIEIGPPGHENNLVKVLN